jgi:hypothetical protein
MPLDINKTIPCHKIFDIDINLVYRYISWYSHYLEGNAALMRYIKNWIRNDHLLDYSYWHNKTHNNYNDIKNHIFFLVFAMDKEKHRQLTMKHCLILSLVGLPKRNVLINTRTLHCNVNLCRTARNKQMAIYDMMLGAGANIHFLHP